jgi:hypothetical protein
LLPTTITPHLSFPPPLRSPLNASPVLLRSNERCEASTTKPHATGNDTDSPRLSTNARRRPTTPANGDTNDPTANDDDGNDDTNNTDNDDTNDDNDNDTSVHDNDASDDDNDASDDDNDTSEDDNDTNGDNNNTSEDDNDTNEDDNGDVNERQRRHQRQNPRGRPPTRCVQERHHSRRTANEGPTNATPTRERGTE